MLIKKIAAAAAAAGALAVAAPSAVARPAVERRPSSVRTPIVQIVIDCQVWACGTNHNRRLLRQP